MSSTSEDALHPSDPVARPPAGGRPRRRRGARDIRRAFADHAPIGSLGPRPVVDTPVMGAGRMPGSMDPLDAVGHRGGNAGGGHRGGNAARGARSFAAPPVAAFRNGAARTA